ncbi:hypothetical protein PVAP13_2KG312700 [Panicum virgatum]|uniref:Uncharacterized protein n=1 Tax=Panicum virgatum TaxID=38727 RepID=A0A8T0W757_PANVG|nr:hypothetical protein PVAP13_2KG312700 [Panicum virgatum]
MTFIIYFIINLCLIFQIYIRILEKIYPQRSHSLRTTLWLLLSSPSSRTRPRLSALLPRPSSPAALLALPLAAASGPPRAPAASSLCSGLALPRATTPLGLPSAAAPPPSSAASTRALRSRWQLHPPPRHLAAPVAVRLSLPQSGSKITDARLRSLSHPPPPPFPSSAREASASLRRRRRLERSDPAGSGLFLAVADRIAPTAGSRGAGPKLHPLLGLLCRRPHPRAPPARCLRRHRPPPADARDRPPRCGRRAARGRRRCDCPRGRRVGGRRCARFRGALLGAVFAAPYCGRGKSLLQYPLVQVSGLGKVRVSHTPNCFMP